MGEENELWLSTLMSKTYLADMGSAGHGAPWALLVWLPDSTVMYIELHLHHRTCANSVPSPVGAAASMLQLEQ